MRELLDNRLVAHANKIPEHAELVLDVVVEPNLPTFCGYYFAHTADGERPSRLLFWGDELPVDDLKVEFVLPFLSKQHLGKSPRHSACLSS